MPMTTKGKKSSYGVKTTGKMKIKPAKTVRKGKGASKPKK